MNGMEDIYILCAAHDDQIEQHLKSTGWYTRRNLNVETIVSQDCRSVGDALRLLDHRDFLKSDFVLVSGDVVTNMNLSLAFKEHLTRRSTDKSAIMSLVMKGNMYPDHRLRLGDLGALTVLDPATKRLLRFEEKRESENSDSRESSIKLDTSFLSGRESVDVRSDLIDTGIYICAPDVLMLFSDNFDYQNVRKDFVTGVLSEEELGNKLYVHEVKNAYATRIRSFRSYAAVSKDILSRWTYPMVPDSNLFKIPFRADDGIGILAQDRWGPPESQFRYSKGQIYIDDCVSISRDANLQYNLCVGNGSIIGPDVMIRNSVIGRNCRFAAGSVIVGSYIGDNVRIDSGVKVNDAMLCDHVMVKEGSIIQPNCILSYGVVIDKNITVVKDTRLSLVKPDPSAHLLSSGSEDDDSHMFGSSPAGYSDSNSAAGGRDMDSKYVTIDPVDQHAAIALANGGVPDAPVDFDTQYVGKMGAGYFWPQTAYDKNPSMIHRKSLAYDIESLAIQENDIESHMLAMEENSLIVQGEETKEDSDSDEVSSWSYI